MQCRDLIPVTVLLGCSEPNLLLNSLVDVSESDRGRGGLPCHSFVDRALAHGELQLILLCHRFPSL